MLRKTAVVAVAIPQAFVARLRRFATPAKLRRYDKLHLGSGARVLEGWANLDINGRGNLVWDLRKPLPLRPGQVRFVYTEHFIEHIPRDFAVKLFTHARRVMAPGGVLRVSTPDLGKFIDDYKAGRVVRMDHGAWYPSTPCQMINELLRLWDHVFVYDQAELDAVLQESGFDRITRVRWGESECAELQGLESRPDFDDLILEART
jgi:predicted SAM-dependent methyltransferase